MEDIETRLDSAIKKVVKEELERIMGIERDVFLEQSNGTRNGHYERGLTTKYGDIDDLKVPGDREGTFRTEIFQPTSDTPASRNSSLQCMQRASAPGRLKAYLSSCSTPATPVPQYQG